MDFVQLRMFCAVAETGSLVRAAEQLHRVPSNLTTRLRQLEKEVGVELFIREKQRMRLSPMGHNFLNYAQRLLTLGDEALRMGHSDKPGGQFALGSMESTAATHLPALLAAYYQRFPAVSLSLTTGTSGDIIERLRHGSLAAALADGPVPHDDLHGCIAFHEQLVLITSLQHKPVRCAADAQDAAVFTFRPSCAYRQRLETWFREGDAGPGAIMEIHSYHAMLACVAGGAGLAIMPRALLAQLPGQQRVRIHSLPPHSGDCTTWLLWRRDAFTPNVEALKQLIIEQAGAPPVNEAPMLSEQPSDAFHLPHQNR